MMLPWRGLVRGTHTTTRRPSSASAAFSAGVSAGIDMALHVVRRLHGEEIARLTARDMEYDWAAPLVG